VPALKLHNDHERPVQLLLEPSGHYFEMPPGSMFEVLPRLDTELEVYHQDPDLMVFGDVSKVVHDGEVLASWDDTRRANAGATSSIERIVGVQQLRDYLLERKESISARPDGALVFRQIMGKSFVARVIWRDEQDLVHVETPLPVSAPAEREAELALAISRIHATHAIPGFRLVHPPSASETDLGLTYWVILMMDRDRSIASTVLERALKVCFQMVSTYEARLAAVAQGKPDPGAPR
jgi:hypothetical protein